MVGIQYHDDLLVGYLEANRIPFVKLEGADFSRPSGTSLYRPSATVLSSV